MDTLLILTLTGIVLIVVGGGNYVLDFIAYKLCGAHRPADLKMPGRIDALNR